LSKDMFSSDENTSKRKDRLKSLIDDLNITTPRLGTTLDNRIDVLFGALKSGTDDEFNALSASGFKELVDFLSATTVPAPPIIDRLREDFVI